MTQATTDHRESLVDPQKATALIYAHWDPNGLIDPYVLLALKQYRNLVKRLVFVSTNYCFKNDELEDTVDDVLIRENVGFDFASWRDGLAHLNPKEYDRIIFCNSSVFGPLWSPHNLLAAASHKHSHLWGMSIAEQPTRHLQSYLMSMSTELITSPFGKRLWGEVYDLATQKEVIECYELRWMKDCEQAGFKVNAVFDQRLQQYASREEMLSEITTAPLSFSRIRRLLRARQRLPENPTHVQWEGLCKAGVPFIKVDLMRDNPTRMNLNRIYAWVSKNTDYPAEVIREAVARMKRQGVSKNARN